MMSEVLGDPILHSTTYWNIIHAATVGYALYIIVESIRQLWFHPLLKYPGLPLAAIMLWWQCYYDIFCNGGGQLLAQLEPLHKKYDMYCIRPPS
jgi:hypothetical protein